MASSAPLVNSSCAGRTPSDSATNFSPFSRRGYFASVRASMLFNLASTRGEQPVVLSFMSRRRSISGLLNGEWYSRISRTHLRALSIAGPHSNGFCVRLQPFGLGQRYHRRADAVQPVTRKLLDRDGLNKILHSKSTSKTGHAARRQHMVRAGGIVSRGLWRIISYKDRTSVAEE